MSIMLYLFSLLAVVQLSWITTTVQAFSSTFVAAPTRQHKLRKAKSQLHYVFDQQLSSPPHFQGIQDEISRGDDAALVLNESDLLLLEECRKTYLEEQQEKEASLSTKDVIEPSSGTNLSVEEWYVRATLASRPKKKKVSLHSTIAGMAVGSLIPIFCAFLQPSFNGVLGFPQLYNFLSSYGTGVTATALQARLGMAFMVLSGLMGMFRFPKSTPRSRKHIFTTLFVTTASHLTASLSNVFGNSSYLFDAWSGIGRLAISAVVLWHIFLSATGIHVMIAAEKDKGMKQKMNPLFENRFLGTLSIWTFILANYCYLGPLCVLLESKANFYNVALPMIRKSGYDLFAQFFRFGDVVYLSMGAFYATLQYEKRTKPWQSFILLGLTFVFTGTLEGCLFSVVMQRNKVFSPLQNHFAGIFQRFHLGKIYFGLYGAVTIYSLCEALWKKRKGQWEA